jgi:putative redox protein
MQVVTKMIDDELYESTSDSDLTLTVDMRPEGTRGHQNPPELLLSALAACSAVDVVSIIRKRKKSIKSFDMVTTGVRRSEHPRAFTNIHCEYIMESDNVTEEELLKAAQLAIEKYCTVASSLKSTITWSAKVVAPRLT